ncbi:MAG: hypothetical protein KGI24_03630 [Candidatus Omnitrophica bacterium]|nr:hypothetical protein [Candidatus Omnitrophota bacterium]
MKFFVITTFINALSFGSSCLLVLLSSFKSKAAKSFALFNCTVALWSFSYFLDMLATHFNEALFYSRCLNAIAIFIPPAFLNFCAKITDNKNLLIKRILLISFCIDVLILPFTFTKYFILSVAPKSVFLFWPVIGPLYYYPIIQFSILLPLAFFILKKKLNASTGKQKKQFQILFYPLLIGFLGGITNYLPQLNVPITPYGNALVPFFIFSIMYLIFKYQIMDIRINLSRSFVYTILIFLITFLYFIATYITDIYLNVLIGYKSFIFSFLAASITALAFIPLKDALQIFIDKYFFKKSIKEIEQENELLKQEIIRSEKMKSIAILASGMAHEIKNPLTPIKTFSEELPKRLEDKEFLLKFSKIINKEVDRIDGLVQELLSYAKPASPELKPISICRLIEQTLSFLNNDIIRHKITLNTSFENKGILINIDPQQIKQALLNIFLNAIDAMPNGGTLSVITKSNTTKQSFIIEISDTGCGISPKDLSHIFDPFFTKKDHGTGLGLSITEGIIKNHNGKILVKSVLNKGTSFRIELPV